MKILLMKKKSTLKLFIARINNHYYKDCQLYPDYCQKSKELTDIIYVVTAGKANLIYSLVIIFVL